MRLACAEPVALICPSCVSRLIKPTQKTCFCCFSLASPSPKFHTDVGWWFSLTLTPDCGYKHQHWCHKCFRRILQCTNWLVFHVHFNSFYASFLNCHKGLDKDAAVWQVWGLGSGQCWRNEYRAELQLQMAAGEMRSGCFTCFGIVPCISFKSSKCQ